ncbi:MAG: M20/M25/M40 family metallo-hydrolase [Clostridiaceae bacterium]|nr:M20/M25/M40 family metallo-hydrolase [Clostridiaceae bacterium]
MSFLKNLYAWFVIARSNFVATFGGWISFALFLFIAIGLIAGMVRTLLAGRHLKRSSPLKRYSPDSALTAHAVESLRTAIAIPTVTGDTEAMEEFRQYLKKRYTSVFEHLNFVPVSGGSLLLRWRGPKGGEKLPVMFCGHMDVVPAGDGWGEDPFSGRLDDDGFIVGRGAIDCKNVVIGLFESVQSLIEEGYSPSRDIYFAFGHDEETGGREGAAKMAEAFEKRGLRFEMVIDEGGYITEEHFGRKRFPAALIGVGEKGCSYYKLTAHGKTGHSSMPPRHSAVGILAEAICRIEAAPPNARLLDVIDENMRLSAPAMRFLYRFTVCNLPISKLLLFRAFLGNPAVNPLFRTTFACTQVWGSEVPNVLPGEAVCMVNARILQGDTPKGILKYLNSLVDDLKVDVEPVLEIPASKISPMDSDAYKKLCEVIEGKYPGLPCIPGIQAITTDSRYYENICDNIFKFMPFVMDSGLYDRMHNSGEKINVNCLGLGIEFYKALIKAL